MGDLVYRKLEKPRNALGHEQNITMFREGDMRWSVEPRRITKLLYYAGAVPYRYILNELPNVSYTENQLQLATGHTAETFEIKDIIGKRQRNKKTEYLVWWQGYLKKDATWEPTAIIEPVAPLLIQAFNHSKRFRP